MTYNVEYIEKETIYNIYRGYTKFMQIIYDCTGSYNIQIYKRILIHKTYTYLSHFKSHAMNTREPCNLNIPL